MWLPMAKRAAFLITIAEERDGDSVADDIYISWNKNNNCACK